MRGVEWFGHRRRPNKHRGDNAPSLERKNERVQQALRQMKEDRTVGRLVCVCKHPQPEAGRCVTCRKDIL